MFDVTLDGDWTKTKRVLTQMPRFIETLKRRLMSEVSQRYYDSLRYHFQQQDLNLEPLSAWYSEWKQKRGLDSRILIATGQMFDAIKIHDDGHDTFVGIKRGKRHRSGIDIALLALVHEYGSAARGVAARPVYRITLQELRAELDGVVKLIIGDVAKEVFG